ncbi:alpha/beta hydrolase [Rickettsiales bacterium]|nr:alpha/beta hydrolase [Rickettsiales bacterium]
MTSIVTFSGWGQQYDSLDIIAPKANHIAYGHLENIDDLFQKIGHIECDILIGWSLGGQISLRAIDKKIIKTKKLVLISTPFQFVEGRGVKGGLSSEYFTKFQSDFSDDPIKTLNQFSLLVARNDKNQKEIIKTLRKNDPEELNWKYWLNELESFSCNFINFDNIPETLIIHGREDSIVDIAQTGVFIPLIKECQRVILDQCSHAPHLHDPKYVKELIYTDS